MTKSFDEFDEFDVYKKAIVLTKLVYVLVSDSKFDKEHEFKKPNKTYLILYNK